MKAFYLALLAIILLSACATPGGSNTNASRNSPAPTQEEPLPESGGGDSGEATQLSTPTVEVESGMLPSGNLPSGNLPSGELPSGEAVRHLMQTGHLRWQTLWIESLGASFPGDGSRKVNSSSREQVWVQQPTRGLALMGAPDGAPGSGEMQMWVSDGASYRDTNGEIWPLPDYVTTPIPPPAGAENAPPPEPPGLQLGIPLSHLIFPVALANRPGEYRTTGREALIGRETYVLEWRPTPGGPVIDRFWVDSATGIILRWENYRKPDGGAITVESYITQILINVEIPINAFNVHMPVPGSFTENPPDLPR